MIKHTLSFFMILLCWNSFTIDQVMIKKLTASSSLIEKNRTKDYYSIDNIYDGTWKSWVEGEDDDGINSIITFEFTTPVNMFRFAIKNGYGDLRYYYLNNRVKDIIITINDSYQVEKTLEDSVDLQVVYLYKYFNQAYKDKIYKLSFQIKSIYPGKYYKDTCISEVIFNLPNSFTTPIFDPYSKELFMNYLIQVNKELDTRVNDDGYVEYLKNPNEIDKAEGITEPYWFTWRWELPDNIFITPYSEPFALVLDDYITYKDPTYARNLNFYIYKNGMWLLDNQNQLFEQIKKYVDKAKSENKPLCIYTKYNSDNMKIDCFDISINREEYHYFKYRYKLVETTEKK